MKLGRYLYHERKGNFTKPLPEPDKVIVQTRQVDAGLATEWQEEYSYYKSDIESMIALLPKSAWKMYNIGSGYNIDLFDKPINTHGCSYVRSFFGSTLLECLQQYVEYKHSLDIKDLPTLF